MRKESISKIEVTDANELVLILECSGDPFYQYIYREAAGVYWDAERNGFKSTPIREWSCSDWYSQIVGIVKSGLGIELQLTSSVEWVNVPLEDRQKIEDRAKSW